MDRKALKEKAKLVIKRNRWLCVIVAFILTLTGGNFGSMSFSFKFEDSDIFEESTAVGGFEEIFNEYFFGIFAGIAAAGIIAFIVGIFVFSALHCGGIRFFLKNRKNNPVEIEELIQNFRDKTFISIGKANLVVALKIILWSMLFIIPGIIKAFEFWAVDYILAVRPNLKGSEATELSKKLMDGHKMDLFVLSLSFLGWNILSAMTLNILGIVYVYPYQIATFCEFYSEIRAEAIALGKITPQDIPDYQDMTQSQDPFMQNANGGFTPGSFSAGQYNAPSNIGAFGNNAESFADFPAEPLSSDGGFSEETATEVPFEPVEDSEEQD